MDKHPVGTKIVCDGSCLRSHELTPNNYHEWRLTGSGVEEPYWARVMAWRIGHEEGFCRLLPPRNR